MKLYFSVILSLGIIAALLLCGLFSYPPELGFYHLLSLLIGCALVAIPVLLFRHFIRNTRVAYYLSNFLAFVFWFFIAFFYPIILGSNHFWGNTITFDILKKYLVSFDSILSILPVEKWIIVSILVILFTDCHWNLFADKDPQIIFRNLFPLSA